MTEHPHHLNPDELDLLLEGRLSEIRTSHLETCEQCRTAAEETREVVAQLAHLPRAVPSPAFADRVMARVSVAPAVEHLVGDELDLWVTGQLPAARQSHLIRCADCRAVADAERVLVMRLEALPLFDPRAGFADRVMGRVVLPVTSIAGAWRLWCGRFVRDPRTVGIAAGAAILVGGSIAASAAWAAANQDVITGTGTWALNHGQQWFWQAVGLTTALLEQQAWYASARAGLTPGRIAALAGCVAMLYAGGVVLLRRLLSLPRSETARALP
jgi:hypothetical protein